MVFIFLLSELQAKRSEVSTWDLRAFLDKTHGIINMIFFELDIERNSSMFFRRQIPHKKY